VRACVCVATLEGALFRNEIHELESHLAAARFESAEARLECASRETQRAAAQAAHERTAEALAALERRVNSLSTSLRESQEEAADHAANAAKHTEEAREWMARATAYEAAGISEAQSAASKEMALRTSLAEMDEAIRRAAFDLTFSRAEVRTLCVELGNEETARAAVEGELTQVRVELERRKEDEQRISMERNAARSAQQAMQQASLQRELRTLQRQLLHPTLALPAPAEADLDSNSEALWAGLLSESSNVPLTERYASIPLAEVHVDSNRPPSVAYAPSEDTDRAFWGGAELLGHAVRVGRTGLSAGTSLPEPLATPTTSRGLAVVGV